MSLRRNEQKADRLDLFKDDVGVVDGKGKPEKKEKNFQN